MNERISLNIKNGKSKEKGELIEKESRSKKRLVHSLNVK